ncbi:aspartate aminotransferase family protein [Rugosimonospora acidiphila]
MLPPHSAPGSDADWLALEAEVCSHGDTVHYARQPRFFARSHGSYLYDNRDTPYLDLQMWYSAVNLGYGNERVNAAVARQLGTLPQLAPQYLHYERVELAARLVDGTRRAFGAAGRVHFDVGGSQAVEDALKLVRLRTGRQRVYAFEGGYHGRTLGASAITSAYRYREPFGEFGDRAEFVPFPYCFRCPYGKRRETCELYCVAQIERKFEHPYTGAWSSRTGRSEFAAFVVEPVQGTGGYVVPPPGYFERLARLCREHGMLLVDDEVQMGFYRTGRLWALEHFDAQPDVVAFGKALTNGLNPLSGIWAREELIGPDAFPPGTTHSTFAANPLGTAAGLEVMKIFEERDYALAVERKGSYLLELLRDLARAHPEIGDVDGLGLALRLEICQADGYTPNQELADAMFQRGLAGDLRIGGRELGLVLDIGGYYKNVITLAPSLDIADEDLELARDLLDLVLIECKQSDR